MRACKRCHYHDNGKCRFNPPTRLPRKFDETATAGNRVREETIIWGWPTVDKDDWCGSYQYDGVTK